MDARRITPDEVVRCGLPFLRSVLSQRHGRLAGRREERVDMAEVAEIRVENPQELLSEN